MGKNKTPKRTDPAAPVREVMDIRDLASYLGIGKSKIYALIRLKKIPASRIGRQYRFSKGVIDQWLKERLITQGEEPQMPLFPGEGEAPKNEPAS
jgi:excisionase family DNA binding protein